jgi:hypothetical protein
MSKTFKNENMFRSNERADVRILPALLGIDPSDEKSILNNLPFRPEDVSIGTESEYQTAVIGNQENVDLPVTIRGSAYFANISRRVKTGDTAKRSVYRLEEFMDDNDDRVWENSWVRFPLSRLKEKTHAAFIKDLRSDKADPLSGKRKDCERFFFENKGEMWIRIPASYVLKLALVDILSSDDDMQGISADWVCAHYLNDNSSPETFSFFPATKLHGISAARNAVHENALRFLLSQCAVMYANRTFGLESYGQKLIVYFSPTTPVRMKKLNSLVSDSFYRELFMSPCLSGWDKGYEKHEYMHLCHQVLSRSHLNSIFKLKDAGIITQPLIRLDSISNTSLANNGTHVSIGSEKLSSLAADNMYTQSVEKSAGDLVIKIFEHFLPLFPGLYSASPWRIPYKDFRPENLVGFLSHELDFTHIRMIWRRWIKKAGLDVFGKHILPYGPDWYEYIWKKIFRFKGDVVPDVRLTDYLVALMSTPESPALDGRVGNDLFLKRDLSHLGVFDEKMSLYLPYKLREFHKMGFSGFEGRFYSLFGAFGSDMVEALEFQNLITGFAWKKILDGSISHSDIPDDTVTESERRQIFFSSAIGIPAVSIREKNPSKFMSSITALASSIRKSDRYQGQLRVRVREYRMALIKMLREDKALVQLFNAHPLLDKLEERIRSKDSTYDKLVSEICKSRKKSPLDYDADDFNSGVESFYRNELRQENIRESLDIFSDCVDESMLQYDSHLKKITRRLCGTVGPGELIRKQTFRIIYDNLSATEIAVIAKIITIYFTHKKKCYDKRILTENIDAPVYRQENNECCNREDFSRQTDQMHLL